MQLILIGYLNQEVKNSKASFNKIYFNINMK